MPSIAAGALLATIVLHGNPGVSAELPTARPEAVGFSAERLQRLDAAMQSVSFRLADESRLQEKIA